MKHPLRILSLLVIVLVLVRGAEYVLEQALDRKLAPLLTDELGLPVAIAPLRADILTLTAHTERLEMGAADRLSIDARDVWVSLNWSDLLSGEIRLVVGGGSELMMDISAWPTTDGPPAQDYADLEQWLPSMLDVDLLRYRREDGVEIAFHQARWRRADGDNASLAWQSRFPTGVLDVDIDLASLDDLLWLRNFDADVTLATDQEQLPVSELKLLVKPHDSRAYALKLSGQLAGMELAMSASGAETWSLPDRSRTRIDTAYLEALQDLVSLLLADGEEDSYQRELSSAVPALDLPRHDAELDLGELRFGKEMLHDVGFRLTTGGQYLAATRITAAGLYGDLLGSAAIASSADGWEVALAADVRAHEADTGLMSRYVTSSWLARQGRIRLNSRGGQWGALLEDLKGSLELSGVFRGTDEKPLRLAASLDGSTDRFALEQIEVQVGSSKLTGRLDASTRGEKFINVQASGDTVDLRFLLEQHEEIRAPGVALPTFLAWLPGYRITLDLSSEVLLMPDVSLQTVSAKLDRGDERGDMSFSARNNAGGSLGITLAYEDTQQETTRTNLDIQLKRISLAELLGLGKGAIDARTSGSIALTAEGRSIEEIFAASRGRADLDIEVRSDGDWTRPSLDREEIDFNGQTSLTLDGNSIVGIQLEQIDIDSLEQDLTGTLSLNVTRDPVLVAELTSERLNIDRIVDWLPTSAAAADEQGALDFMRDLSPGHIKLRVESLTWLDRSFDKLLLELTSKPRFFSVDTLELQLREAALDGKLTLDWEDGQTASLDARASVKNLRMLEILDIDEKRLRDNLGAPLEGNLHLSGKGPSIQALIIALDGELLLKSTDDTEQNPDILDITFESQPDSGEINFRQLKLAGSDLQGSLKTTTGTPTRYDLKLTGGTLDLTPWELARKPASKKSDDSSVIQQTTDTARGLVGFATRMLGGNGGPTEAGERIFSAEPLDVKPLSENSVTIEGQLGRLYSGPLVAEELDIDLQVGEGKISLAARVDQANGGPLSLDVALDASVTPHRFTLEGIGQGVYPRPDQSSYPTSAHGVFSSTGSSEAELAAALSGQLYLELGRGPINYGRLAFVTADVGSSMIRALIPGAKNRTPQVQCGVTFMHLQDGIGVTPYGYAVQTRSANLLGGMEVNLIDETMRLRFQSRSREGAGISIGNAFAGSVELAGPLGDPQIVPNTPGLLFRGWAAFMTAGISVIGESVMNRVLASSNPCKPVKEELRKEVCDSEQLLSGSPLACPSPETATN